MILKSYEVIPRTLLKRERVGERGRWRAEGQGLKEIGGKETERIKVLGEERGGEDRGGQGKDP